MIRSIDTSALRKCVCSVSRCILSKTLGVRSLKKAKPETHARSAECQPRRID